MRDIDGQRLFPGDRARVVGDKVPTGTRLKVVRIKGHVSEPDGLIERAVMRNQLREMGLHVSQLVDIEPYGWFLADQLQIIRVELQPATKSFNELIRDLQ